MTARRRYAMLGLLVTGLIFLVWRDSWVGLPLALTALTVLQAG